jgi:peptidoglycan/xylan/chitin deacetylase (PgdA/CDA1 family)
MIRRIDQAIRSRWLKHAARRLPIILMYHRVAHLEHDPWNLAVSPENFKGQIERIRRARRITPLSEIMDPAPTHDQRPAVAVTFDDGYADVLTNAGPILKALDCPATLFLTTGALGLGRGFWWDELASSLLAPAHLPSELCLTFDGVEQRWNVTDQPAIRRRIHDAVWALLRPQSDGLRREQLDRLADWAGLDADNSTENRVMSRAEAQSLASFGISIGAHSVHHPQLTTLDSRQAAAEIRDSLKACTALSGEAVTSFAYPYGDHDPRIVDLARQEGVRLACIVQPGGVTRTTEALLLPRYTVTNLAPDAFARWLP